MSLENKKPSPVDEPNNELAKLEEKFMNCLAEIEARLEQVEKDLAKAKSALPSLNWEKK